MAPQRKAAVKDALLTISLQLVRDLEASSAISSTHSAFLLISEVQADRSLRSGAPLEDSAE